MSHFCLAVSCYLGKANLNDLHTGVKMALTHELIWDRGRIYGAHLYGSKSPSSLHRCHYIVANEENI